MFEKVSRSLKYDSNFFPTTNIYIFDHFTPLALRVRGKKVILKNSRFLYLVYIIDARALQHGKGGKVVKLKCLC